MPLLPGILPLSAPALGAISSCPLCSSALSLTGFSIERPWQPQPAKRTVDRSEDLKLAVPPSIGQFADFVRARAYLLAEWPALAWQEAANAAAETAPKAAVAARLSGRMKRPGSGGSTGRGWRRLSHDPHRTHEGTVVDVAASNDGRRILSLGIDGSLRVWDAESGAPVMVKRDAGGPGESGRFRLVSPRPYSRCLRKQALQASAHPALELRDGPAGPRVRRVRCEAGFSGRESRRALRGRIPAGRRSGKDFRAIVLLWDLERRMSLPLRC